MSFSSNLRTTSATITDTEFRNICTDICNTLESGGNLLVADSGDGDPASATFPGVNTTVSFYQIRRFSDTLQGTVPCFYKIDFGRGAGSNIVQIGITIGTGSDGAGNITGTRLARFTFGLSTTITSQPLYVSAGTDRMLFAFCNGTSNACLLTMERTRDIAGVATNEGLMVSYKSLNSGSAGWWGHQVILWTGTNPIAESSTGGVVAPGSQSSGIRGSDVTIWPWFYYGVGKGMPPGLNVWGAFNGDFTNQTQYTINMLGTNRNYVFIVGSAMAPRVSGSTGMGAMLLAE